MKRSIIKTISFILALTLSLGSLAACGELDEMTGGGIGDSDSTNTNTDAGDSAVLTIFESLQDNDSMPFTITDKAKEMLSAHEAFFLENKNDGLDEHTDLTLEYKILNKNIDKHGDKLLYLDEAYVLSIYETEIDEETTLSEIQLLDAEDNNYYCFSLCAYDDVYEGDIVSVYALPIGETSFENIGGGTTLAIVLAGCYIEKLEVE